MTWKKNFVFFLFFFFFSIAKAEVILSSASSLQPVMLAIIDRYHQQNNQRIIINSAASGILARQIAVGGKINIFVSANKEWIDFLQEKNLIDKNQRYDLVFNKLVLAKNCSNSQQSLFQAKKIAVGDFAYVPAGQYTKNYLENTEQLERVKPKIVFTNSEHQAVLYIQKKLLDMAFIYHSSLQTYQNLCLVEEISHQLSENITYQMVLIARFVNQDTLHFANFLRSKDSFSLFKEYGFF